MMEDFIGTYGNNLIVAVVGVGVALLLLAIILWLIRRRGGSSPFIRGGKSRQPRLQVLDAAAVDARRRLVLVRRDNVEHLVMIGGPTDIVIESGIGAIPFMKDVREPQDEMLPAPPVEKAIAPSRTRALPQERDEDLRPVSTPAAATPAPQPEKRPAPAPAPAAAVRPAPAPPPAPTPRSPAPVTQPVAPPHPAVTAAPQPVPPPRPAPAVTPAAPTVTPPAPRAIAREPITPSIAPAVVPAVTAATLTAEPIAKSTTAPEVDAPQPFIPAPAIAPADPVPTPVIDQTNAADFLDAARERVLPTFTMAEPIEATVTVAKPEPLAPSDNGPVFGDQLTSDFESFLEAEIAKNNAAEAPDVSIEPERNQDAPQPVSPPVSDGTADSEVQKEMARIFGEMAVTRDK
ncbi:flagellar biosynthetic protein FliO [Rhizobium sp. Leaf262]|uniref:flagellar biosynthetic protein FliO n=1 Tax=Rhizobium sp. Leaf262 TaxID=1736312 RepID=UPI000713A9EF|nr:flagellar biosynthetic protein FliO [Rhizobium sp. Leaf262]KQO80934.1 hypothetical protein ASF29_19220 [Rhizobium sp. Leaf262]